MKNSRMTPKKTPEQKQVATMAMKLLGKSTGIRGKFLTYSYERWITTKGRLQYEEILNRYPGRNYQSPA